MSDNILQVKDLKVYFPMKGSRKDVKAVDGISFNIKKGETLGLVGESGCGKSTTGRAILRLVKPTAGEIYFENEEILTMGKGQLKQIRKDIQLIFQDPFASLNPRMSIGDTIEEVLHVHKYSKDTINRKKRTEELLELVGLNKSHISRYPHEFSGGQRQRIVIARALAVEPKLIVCDEPVSALDVSIQAQVINLLEDLQKRLDLTYLFIAHDLSVISHISDKTAVMYLGKIMEIAESAELFKKPRHPYTKALIAAIPKYNDNGDEPFLLKGDIPSPIDPPRGCRFHTRCIYKKNICMKEEPVLRNLDGHIIACHFDL